MTPGKDAHSPTTVEESIVPSLSTMSQRSTQSSPTSSSLQAGSACAQRRPPSTGGKFQIPSPSFPYPPSNVPCLAWGSPQRLGCLAVSLSRLSLPGSPGSLSLSLSDCQSILHFMFNSSFGGFFNPFAVCWSLPTSKLPAHLSTFLPPLHHTSLFLSHYTSMVYLTLFL